MQVSAIRLKTFRVANQSTEELCQLIKDKSFDDAIQCVKRLRLLQTFRHSDYATGLTPLHLAIQSQNFDLIEAILEKGIDPNEKDATGNNAYHYAAETLNAQILLLVEKYDKDKSMKYFEICRLS